MLRIILDIEPRNHLQKECGKDSSKLKIGLVGIKILGKNKFLFFDERNLKSLKVLLERSNEIIGFNLVGHNGLDYVMLENHGIAMKNKLYKTFDLMTLMIRTFGSYEGMGLDNIVEHTFGIKKKKSKKANYKLLRSGQVDKVKENLKHELKIIEKVYKITQNGGLIRFRTPLGLVDEHELSPLAGFSPEPEEDVISPYDLPFGMRLQIKDKKERIVQCANCKKRWKIESICYYGDTMSEDVYCPDCGAFLTETRSNSLGISPRIYNVS